MVNHLEKRLAAYAVSAGVALIATPLVDAQVVYTDIEPDVCLTAMGPDGDVARVDLDGDGFDDFEFSFFTSFLLPGGCATGSCNADIDGYFFDARFMAIDSEIGGRPPNFFAQDLASGDLISAGQNFENLTYGFALFSYGFGAWHGGNDAFAGLRFMADGGTTLHYGWVRLTAPPDIQTLCIREMAYESTPNASILAGQRADLALSCTPVSSPVVVPAGGGSYDYDIEITNNGATSETVDIWFDIDGPGVDLTKGPITRTIAAGATLSRTVTQNVPGFAPAGDYVHQCNVGAFPAAHGSNSFDWEKSAVFTPGDVSVADWSTEAEIAAALGSETAAEVPADFGLETNYPNPFNPSTTIRFDLPESVQVRLAVYDVLGRQISVLADGMRESGMHEVVFDATDLPSGTYLYRLETPQGAFTRTMLLGN